jgi:hypothetical protein
VKVCALLCFYGTESVDCMAGSIDLLDTVAVAFFALYSSCSIQ